MTEARANPRPNVRIGLTLRPRGARKVPREQVELQRKANHKPAPCVYSTDLPSVYSHSMSKQFEVTASENLLASNR